MDSAFRHGCSHVCNRLYQGNIVAVAVAVAVALAVAVIKGMIMAVVSKDVSTVELARCA